MSTGKHKDNYLMRIAILSRPDDRSPKILAQSLKQQLAEQNIHAELIPEVNFLTRQVTFRESGLNFHFWLREKVVNYLPDQKILNRLKRFDAVIISECIPNAFFQNLYNINSLKRILKKPVLLFEVYHIENAPTQIQKLVLDDEYLNLYDGYLYVSPVTEIRKKNTRKGFCVGLQSRKWGLIPRPKEGLQALIDFPQPSYGPFREHQIKTLEKAGIPYLCLEGSYTIEEIRGIYQKATMFFIQSPEAFCLPILECLNCGVQIFTPDSGWPMSWRLNEDASVHGQGLLPECFTTYADEEDLFRKLNAFKDTYDVTETPLKIWTTFKQHYSLFYNGNEQAIEQMVAYIEKNALSANQSD